MTITSMLSIISMNSMISSTNMISIISIIGITILRPGCSRGSGGWSPFNMVLTHSLTGATQPEGRTGGGSHMVRHTKHQPKTGGADQRELYKLNVTWCQKHCYGCVDRCVWIIIHSFVIHMPTGTNPSCGTTHLDMSKPNNNMQHINYNSTYIMQASCKFSHPEMQTMKCNICNILSTLYSLKCSTPMPHNTMNYYEGLHWSNHNSDESSEMYSNTGKHSMT